MSNHTVDWLVQEVRDLLDVSSTGLYEFLELLDVRDEDLSVPERMDIAASALQRLLREDGVRLYRLTWSDQAVRTELALDSLPADPWLPPDEDGRYIAVDRPS
ncbi:MAG TPA: hypothetical protein VF657_04705 [Actinoplanes sp.]|jgi:hypothetical protein